MPMPTQTQTQPAPPSRTSIFSPNKIYLFTQQSTETPTRPPCTSVSFTQQSTDAETPSDGAPEEEDKEDDGAVSHRSGRRACTGGVEDAWGGQKVDDERGAATVARASVAYSSTRCQILASSGSIPGVAADNGTVACPCPCAASVDGGSRC
jgi:hypothetical protein